VNEKLLLSALNSFLKEESTQGTDVLTVVLASPYFFRGRVLFDKG
jgi:hypothetical protein